MYYRSAKKSFHFSFLFIFIIVFSLLSFLIPLGYASDIVSSKCDAEEDFGSDTWVRGKIIKYPELNWLLDEAIVAAQMQEGTGKSPEMSWSKTIKGVHYPEFERTILSMVCFHLFNSGTEKSYEHLTRLQVKEEKLTLDNFNELHKLAEEVKGFPMFSTPEEAITALEVILLIEDMGRSSSVRSQARSRGVESIDHHHFIESCLEVCPELFPSFTSLPLAVRSFMLKSSRLVHFGHFSQVEGDPNMLKKLKSFLTLDLTTPFFNIQVLKHLCEVGGACGHINNQSSLLLTGNTFRAINAVRQAITFLSTHTEEEALAFYLNTRAEWLDIPILIDEKRLLLARLGAMCRLFTPGDGKILLEAYESLPDLKKSMIESELYPLISRIESTPTYTPAIVRNLIESYSTMGMSREEALKKGIQEGACFIAQVLHDFRTGKLGSYSPDISLNFNIVASQVRDYPGAFMKMLTYALDKEGIIRLDIPLGPE